MENQLIYLLALTFIQSIGAVTARKLIAYAGSPEAVLKENKDQLRKIPGIGNILSSRVGSSDLLKKAEKEVNFCLKRNINILSYYSTEFPARLKQCPDAPLVLFYKGEYVFNSPKMISIVGTRRASNYGNDLVQRVIKDLSVSHPDTVVVSGLAYGIDYQAHYAALQNGLKTIAVLGHGLHTIYPSSNSGLAIKIIEQGCLVSDFTSDMKPERNNFIKRNRIIAGLSDATLVAESGIRGGALITADIAGSYNRDVFAFPGRVDDEMSKGCNNLIKANKANMVENYEDIQYFMDWDPGNQKATARQKLLFTSLSPEEEMIVNLLKEENTISLNALSIRLDWPVNKVSSCLLNLEFEGLIRVLPGNFYKLN